MSHGLAVGVRAVLVAKTPGVVGASCRGSVSGPAGRGGWWASSIIGRSGVERWWRATSTGPDGAQWVTTTWSPSTRTHTVSSARGVGPSRSPRRS